MLVRHLYYRVKNNCKKKKNPKHLKFEKKKNRSLTRSFHGSVVISSISEEESQRLGWERLQSKRKNSFDNKPYRVRLRK